LRTSMQSARSALETAITSNDSTAIAAQASQIGSLTAQQVLAQATAAAAFYAILTPDQETKFTELKDLGLGLPGGPGFGGPSFGGPGPRRH
jgi:Spy/CpxP family protein refolding chaperone